MGTTFKTDEEFEAFYERHWKYVYRLCMTYMKSAADAEDCAEDEAKLAASEYEKIDNVIKSIFGTLPKNLAVIKEPEIPDNGGFDGGFDNFEDMPIIGG